MNKDYAEKLAADRIQPNSVGGRLASSASETNGCEAQRQKYWSELKEHERIDRLREVVKRYENRLEELENCIRALVQHTHNPGGNMVSPFQIYPPPQFAEAYPKDTSRGPDDIYF